MEEWQITLEKYISEKFDDIEHVKKAVDFDTEGKRVNVAYRLPHDMLVSLGKRYDTLDNDEVTFGLYHKRECLILDWGSYKLFHKYLKNAEEKIKDIDNE